MMLQVVAADALPQAVKIPDSCVLKAVTAPAGMEVVVSSDPQLILNDFLHGIQPGVFDGWWVYAHGPGEMQCEIPLEKGEIIFAASSANNVTLLTFQLNLNEPQ